RDRATALNDWLRGEAKARDHLGIIDWSGTSSGRTEWFWEDGLHITPDGGAAYAGLLRAEIDAHCGGPVARVPIAPPPPTPREPVATTTTTTELPG
ncbi:MAG: hypothetical protein AAGK32_20430, partial [Actinomycetota bacterium]